MPKQIHKPRYPLKIFYFSIGLIMLSSVILVTEMVPAQDLRANFILPRYLLDVQEKTIDTHIDPSGNMIAYITQKNNHFMLSKATQENRVWSKQEEVVQFNKEEAQLRRVVVVDKDLILFSYSLPQGVDVIALASAAGGKGDCGNNWCTPVHHTTTPVSDFSGEKIGQTLKVTIEYSDGFVTKIVDIPQKATPIAGSL